MLPDRTGEQHAARACIVNHFECDLISRTFVRARALVGINKQVRLGVYDVNRRNYDCGVDVRT